MPTLRPSIWFLSSLAISSQPAARAGEARAKAASSANVAAAIVDLYFCMNVTVKCPRLESSCAGSTRVSISQRTLREDGLPGQARQRRYSRQILRADADRAVVISVVSLHPCTDCERW